MMGDHYPLCERYISGDGLPCICELLTVHADDMHIATMTDLRAKVEALPVVLGLSSLDASLTDAVRLRDVLALLPPDPRPGPLPPLAASPPAAPGLPGAGRDEPTGDAR